MKAYIRFITSILTISMCFLLVSCEKSENVLGEQNSIIKSQSTLAKQSDTKDNTILNEKQPTTIQTTTSSSINACDKMVSLLYGLSPKDVIKKYFEYFNNKDADGYNSTFVSSRRCQNDIFAFKNLEYVKLKNITDADEIILDRYMSYGNGSVNNVKVENVKVYKVDFETKYSKETPPNANGKLWDYFFLIKETDESPWLIDDVGV